MAVSDLDSSDVFWIEPIRIDGGVARIHASFNDYSVAILVERKDDTPISQQEAKAAFAAVIARLPERPF